MSGGGFVQKLLLYGRVLVRYGLEGFGSFHLAGDLSGAQDLHHRGHNMCTTNQVLVLLVATGQLSQSHAHLSLK